jgi:hypothetical protein
MPLPPLSCLWLLSGTLIAFFQTSAKQEGWGKVKSESGVEVFEKKVNGKLAFRGVAYLEGKPAKLVGVLQNTNRWRHWIKNLQSGRLLEKKPTFTRFSISRLALLFRSVTEIWFTNRK